MALLPKGEEGGKEGPDVPWPCCHQRCHTAAARPCRPASAAAPSPPRGCGAATAVRGSVSHTEQLPAAPWAGSPDPRRPVARGGVRGGEGLGAVAASAGRGCGPRGATDDACRGRVLTGGAGPRCGVVDATDDGVERLLYLLDAADTSFDARAVLEREHQAEGHTVVGL